MPDARVDHDLNRQPILTALGNRSIAHHLECLLPLPLGRQLGDAASAQNFNKLKRLGFKPRTVEAAKGLFRPEYVRAADECESRPPSPADNRPVPGVDWRSFRPKSFPRSQRRGKLIEQAFGRGKTGSGLRKTRHRGVEKNRRLVHFLTAAYQLLRTLSCQQRRQTERREGPESHDRLGKGPAKRPKP
jgi:hypothetical protein